MSDKPENSAPVQDSQEPIAPKTISIRDNPSFWQDLKQVRPSDLLSVLQIPCSRTSFLYGLAGGACVGLLHFGLKGKLKISQSTVLASCHRAVAGFVFISLITWEKCRYDRARAENNVRLVTQQLRRLTEEKAKNTQKVETAPQIDKTTPETTKNP